MTTLDYQPLPTRTRSRERADFLSGIITTALEGGIGYWAAASVYKWWSPDLRGGTAEHRDGEANAYAVIYEDSDSSGETAEAPGEHFVGVEQVAAAVARIIASCSEITEDGTDTSTLSLKLSYRRTIRNASEENDYGDIDADLADCIVQVAVFGRVIYG